jgi:predicted RNA-binding Zn ribbon-like protein
MDPGLARIERFVNTADLDQGTDELEDAAGASAWLAEEGLPADVDAEDHERLVAFREAIRGLLLANHGGTPDPAAVATLDGAAALTVAFAADGSARLEPAAHGVDAVLAQLAAIIARAQAEGTWTRLKACPNDTCGWAFYDRSRNRSRTWCAMSVCGNRAKARSYRARHR